MEEFNCKNMQNVWLPFPSLKAKTSRARDPSHAQPAASPANLLRHAAAQAGRKKGIRGYVCTKASGNAAVRIRRNPQSETVCAHSLLFLFGTFWKHSETLTEIKICTSDMRLEAI